MSRKKTLWIMFAIVVVDMLGVGILIPIIPLLFSDPSYAYYLPVDASTGYLLLGALTAIYPFMMFLAMPILGQLSDTFGRKPVLIFSLLGTTLSYVLFALGIIFRSIPLLFISRAFDGVTGANMAVAQAAVADTTSDNERVRSFGLLSAANGIGFILGPLFAEVLSQPKVFNVFGAPTPFWVAAGLSFLNMLAVLFFFTETRTVRAHTRIRMWQAFANIKEAAIGQTRRVLYITAFLYQSGFAFIVTFFGVYLIARFGYGQGYIGYMFSFVGLLLALTQLFITGPLSKRFPPETVIPAALGMMSVSLMGIYFSRDPISLYLLLIPASIAGGLILANLTALISTSSRTKEQGSALGINSSVQALAQSIPPVFAGIIAAIFAPTTPILFAAASIGAAGMFFVVARRHGH